jgi:KaiC/GvpD/RAD55 family RecA-like ATPase
MREMVKSIPTGIASLDSAIGGGFPAGSLVLLRGEIGSGHKEFMMTSAMMTAALRKGLIKPTVAKDVFIPKEVWWATFTRSPEDLLQEVSLSFEKDLYDLFENVKFRDFSMEYFRASPVPMTWVSEEAEKRDKKAKLSSLEKAFGGVHRKVTDTSLKPKALLESLTDFLTDNAPNNVVVLHSLSDIARLYSDSDQRWYDFTLFIRGLQRAAKNWGGVIYTNMISNILSPDKEQEIAACVDGVLEFTWEEAGSSRRRRVLYFRKFRGLMPRMNSTTVIKFEVEVSPKMGFEVTKAEMIEGLR